MTLEIIRPGLFTTLQDLGRHGYQRHGIVVSGAMDSFALRAANLLVGNEEREGVLEITLTGPVIEFQRDTLIAICGADLSAMCQGQPLPLWRPVLIRGGARLEFGRARSGCRAYLAVAGGFDVAAVLGSKSTYLRAGIGGWRGRLLQKGDMLPVGSLSTESQRLRKIVECGTQTPFFATVNWAVSRGIIPEYRSQPTLRVVKGNEFEAFTFASRHDLFNTPYQVSLQSDRMGYRLQGAALSLETPLELISEAVAFGTIQVPPEGQPIVLMADRQTTGGYPKIADVISVDLPLLAQVKPGESVRFVPVGLEEAQELYIKREWEIRFLKQGIHMQG